MRLKPYYRPDKSFSTSHSLPLLYDYMERMHWALGEGEGEVGARGGRKSGAEGSGGREG